MSSYVKGRYYEYRVKSLLEKCGYIVFRSAGSHGLFDLIAINPNTKIILFIQVKKNKVVDENIRKVKEIFKNFGKQANVYFQLWYVDKKKLKSENILF